MAMPVGENTQNSEVTSTCMHEIPLSNEQDEQDEQAPVSIETIPSKSSSLKRFFKLGINKKVSNDASNEDVETTGNDADTEEGNEEIPPKIEEVENLETPKDNAEEIKRSRSRRFNFRFHGTNVESDTPSSSTHAPNLSRHSLRDSLSTYFSSVFKRKQNSSKHSLRFLKKKDFKKPSEEQELEEEIEANKEAIQHKVTEENDIESQTAEIINELETLTVSEQNDAVDNNPIPMPHE